MEYAASTKMSVFNFFLQSLDIDIKNVFRVEWYGDLSDIAVDKKNG